MNHFLKRLLIRYLKRRPKGSFGSGYNKSINNLEVEVTHEFSDFIYLLLGITSAAFGLKGFLMPSAFIDGGVMGISLMINGLFGISLSILIICFNLPFLALAYISIGKRFAVKSVIGIIVTYIIKCIVIIV